MFYQFDNYIVDKENHKLFCGSKIISDDEKTVNLLCLLCEKSPETVDKQELLDVLWSGQIVTEWSLSKLVSDVRHLLGDTGKEQGFIKTIRGKGFRFNALVKQSDLMPENKVHSVTSNPVKQSKNILQFKLLLVASVAIAFVIFYFSDHAVTKYDDKTIRVAVMPVLNQSNDPINEWVKYGVMSMVSEQLARYQSIQTLPVSTVISAASSINKLEDISETEVESQYFDDLCQQMGCSHLVVIKYKIEEDSNPIFSYQIFKKDYRSAINDFPEPDIFDAVSLLLDYLVRDLIPSEKQILPLQNTFSKDNKANRDYGIGMNELFEGDVKSAKTYLELALVRQPDFFWAKANLADAHYRSGDLKKSSKLIQLLKEEKLSPQQGYFLDHLLSNLLYAQGQLDESLQISIRLQNNLFVQDDPLLLANELLNIGSGYQAKSELKKAAKFLEQAQKQYAKAEYGAGEGKALFNLGNVYLTLTEKKKAIDYYQKAREIFIRYKMSGYALIAKHQIASTSIYLGNVKFAEAELRTLVKDYQEIGDLQGELTAKTDLVLVSLFKKEPVEVIDRTELLLPIIDKTEFSYLKGHLRQLVIVAHLRLSQVEQAEQYMEYFGDEWTDQRPAFAFIPAHILQAKGQFKAALDLAESIKHALGDEWIEAHQAVLVQFEESVKLNKVIPIHY